MKQQRGNEKAVDDRIGSRRTTNGWKCIGWTVRAMQERSDSPHSGEHTGKGSVLKPARMFRHQSFVTPAPCNTDLPREIGWRRGNSSYFMQYYVMQHPIPEENDWRRRSFQVIQVAL